MVYVNFRKNTFCLKEHVSGKLFSIVVPLSGGCNNDVNSEGVTIECTIFDDDSMSIELIENCSQMQNVIAECLLPTLMRADLNVLAHSIIEKLKVYKNTHNPIANDEDSEVIVCFADEHNDCEWDEHFGFKNAHTVDFWNEHLIKPLWDARQFSFLEKNICTARDDAAKWMEL